MAAAQIPIQARAFPISALLSGARQLRIPDFQRPYTWGDDQIKDFWDDISDTATQQSTHFFGTLLTSPGDHPASGDSLDVLDGQQRLTTFSLMLVALDREFETLEDPTAAKRVREGAAASRVRVQGALRTAEGDRRVRLRSSDDHLLGSLVTGNPAEGTVGTAFSQLVGYLRTELDAVEDRYGRANEILEAVLDRSVLIHAHCLAGFDPFVVFSTLNATGLPLTATQILRARSLGLVNPMSRMVREQTADAWDGIERLGDDGDRFLRELLVLRTGARVQAKDIVRQFDQDVIRTRQLPKSGLDREQHFLDIAREIEKLVPLYRDLAGGKWPGSIAAPPSEWHAARVRFLVKSLGVKQVLPLLIASAAALPDQLFPVLDVVERAAFVSLVCLDNQTRWGDKAFELAKGVFDGELGVDDIRTSVNEFFQAQLTDPPLVFSRRLPELLRYNGRRKTQIRYFLTTVNDWGFPEGQPFKEPDIQAAWNLGDIHIDHIAPQKGFGMIAEIERDRLGNLTPLRGKHNSGLSNRPFPDKVGKYGESPLRITRALKDLDEWDTDALDSREAQLTAFATELFCRDLKPEA